MKFLFFCLLVPCQLLSQRLSEINGFADSLMASVNSSEVPASLLIVAKDGIPIVRKAYGMASLELATPARPEQLFTLASVNKQMIAVSILQLAQQAKLKLTDDIRVHLPGINTHGETIIVEQLLNHTSGIFSGNGAVRGKSFYEEMQGRGVLTDKEFLNYAMHAPLNFKPGTDWSWNTWAFHIAFFIVENVSGMPFNEYARRYLFEPAGMKNSFSKIDGNRLGLYGIPNLLSSFYYKDFDGKWVWRDTRALLPYYFYQRYSVVTSLDDLVKWDAALRAGRLLPLEWLDKAWQKGKLKDGRSTNYGLGWVVSEYGGYRLISHIGIGTNPICVVHVPEAGLYIAYTQFFGNYEQVELKVKKILSRMLGLPYPADSKAESPLTDYTGVYAVHRNGLDLATQVSDMPVYIYVQAKNDTLYMRQTAGEPIALRPAGKDRFMPVGNENTFYVFSRSSSGKINAISSQGSFWQYGPEVFNYRVAIPVPTPIVTKRLPDTLLKRYAGIYHMSSLDSYILIEADSSSLYNVVPGRRQQLLAKGHNEFIKKGSEDVTFLFTTGHDGNTTLLVTGLRKLRYKKITVSLSPGSDQ